MTQKTPQPPAKEFRAGGVSASIWHNETEQDGRTIVQHSVRINKRYRDPQTGDWRDSDYFFANDLPRLRLVLAKAYEHIVLKTRDGHENCDDPDSAPA